MYNILNDKDPRLAVDIRTCNLQISLLHDPYEFIRQARNYLNENHDESEVIKKLKEKYPGMPDEFVKNIMYIARNESFVEDWKSPSGLAGILMLLYSHDVDIVRKELKERGLDEDQIRDAIQVAEAELRQSSAAAVTRPEILERQALDILILSSGIESQARSDLENSFPHLADHIIERAVQVAMSQYPQDAPKRMKENPLILLDYVHARMSTGKEDLIKELKERWPHLSTEEIKHAMDMIGSEMYN